MKYNLSFILILVILPINILSYIIGVDIGSEFFKICVIRPGRPFSIVENLQSKLKTSTALSIKDDELAYGPDALVKKSRFPKNIFTHFENYLGVSYNDTFIQKFLKDFLVSYDITENPRRHSIEFNINFNNDKYMIPIEIIYGMLFDHIKFISEKYAGIEITDTFVTIPSFFNYKQRNALAQGIELSKLRLTGFVSESLSAAVQFQLKRKFEKNEYFIFYNMGASYTQVCLVEYSQIKKNNNTNTSFNKIHVLGEAWDRELGGNYFDKNLVKLMMDKFDKMTQRQGKDSIKDNKKVFEKMLPHSVKCKEVLSANKECYVAVLSVDKGMNLEGSITRQEFIEVNSELLNKVYKPIQELLDKNNMTIANISGVELIGGSIRIPRVKEIIEENLGKNKDILGSHMNGDDSMAFGAAYMAANASVGFRGKRTYMANGGNSELKIYLSDYSSKKIEYCPKESDINNNSKVIKKINSNCIHSLNKSTVLIPFRYPFDSIRTVNLLHDSDIFIKVTEKMCNENKEVEIMNITVTGVRDFINKMIKINETSAPKISLRFFYTKGGQLELTALASYDEILYLGKVMGPNGTEKVEWSRNVSAPLSKKEIDEIDYILNTSTVLKDSDIFKDFYKTYNSSNSTRKPKKSKYNKNTTNTTNTTNITNNTQLIKNDTNSTNSNNTNNKTITEHERDELLLKKRIGESRDHTVEHYLTVIVNHTYPKPLNSSEIYKAKKTIKKFYEIDKNRTLLIEVKNGIESRLYKSKEFLESTYVKDFGNETEIENTHKYISNLSSWYEEDGIIAPLEVLQKEVKNIDKHFAVYHKRMLIQEKRNKAILRFETELNNTILRAQKLIAKKKWLMPYLNETFNEVIYNVSDKLSEKLKLQESKKLYEKPAISEKDIKEYINLIHDAYYNLSKIKKPVEKKEKNDTLNDLFEQGESLSDLIVSLYYINYLEKG